MTPWTVASQAHLSMRFSRREYRSVLPWPLSGDLPNSVIELVSLMFPALAGKLFITSAPLVLMSVINLSKYLKQGFGCCLDNPEANVQPTDAVCPPGPQGGLGQATLCHLNDNR